MSELEQYMTDHGPQNPEARTAVLVGTMMMSSAKDYADPKDVSCCSCGYSAGDKVEAKWSVSCVGINEEGMDIAFLCPTCAASEHPQCSKAVGIPRTPATFQWAMRDITKHIPKGHLAAVHAFTDNHHAWYLVPTPTGFIAVHGPGVFYEDFGFEHTLHTHKTNSDVDAVLGARMTLGTILGTCTVEQFGSPLPMVNITGEVYRGPFPLPAAVAKRVRQQLDKEKAHTEVQA